MPAPGILISTTPPGVNPSALTRTVSFARVRSTMTSSGWWTAGLIVGSAFTTRTDVDAVDASTRSSPVPRTSIDFTPGSGRTVRP